MQPNQLHNHQKLSNQLSIAMSRHSKQHLHFAMLPWLAAGHIKPYMQLSNKLAEQGHRVTFFLPSKLHPSISRFNIHPDLITLIPIALPQVPGLDPIVQTTADCDFPTHRLLATAFDRTAPFIQAHLQNLRPDAVFFDFAHWIPDIAKTLGILSIYFFTTSAATLVNYAIQQTEPDPPLPLGFPRVRWALSSHEARSIDDISDGEYGDGITLRERLKTGLANCDAVAFRTLKELEGCYLDYIETSIHKPVFPVGHALLPPPAEPLVEKMQQWLGRFELKSVIYCSFGSECILALNQFQELLLGFELTGFPFLVALRPPAEVDSVESALPEGFKERAGERGIVTSEWVQQQHILGHASVGCFVTHCGTSSTIEGLMSECQLVMMPYLIMDQIVNAKVMSRDIRVSVEVERGDEDGLFDRHGVCEAVKQVMNMEGGIGKEVKVNHDKLREVLFRPGLENACIEDFVTKVKQLSTKCNSSSY